MLTSKLAYRWQKEGTTESHRPELCSDSFGSKRNSLPQAIAPYMAPSP